MRILLLALLAAAAACSEPPLVPVDMALPDAMADVGGQVLKASGAPVQSGSVSIRCADGQIGASTPIDAQGHYHALLGTSAELLGGDSGRVPCLFTGPGGIRVERTIGFGPSGLPHALQIVDLRAG